MVQETESSQVSSMDKTRLHLCTIGTSERFSNAGGCIRVTSANGFIKSRSLFAISNASTQGNNLENGDFIFPAKKQRLTPFKGVISASFLRMGCPLKSQKPLLTGIHGLTWSAGCLPLHLVKSICYDISMVRDTGMI